MLEPHDAEGRSVALGVVGDPEVPHRTVRLLGLEDPGLHEGGKALPLLRRQLPQDLSDFEILEEEEEDSEEDEEEEDDDEF